jgi:hypothetical protein
MNRMPRTLRPFCRRKFGKENTVLTTRKVSLVALALASAGLAACGESGSSASQEDLKRDLQLASATTMNLAAPRVDSSLLTSMETTPQGTPEASKSVKKGAGPRAVHSETPTVHASPDVDVAAVEESDEVQTESVAPVPEPTPEPVAVAPRPAPVVIPASTGGDYGSGGGIFGGTDGSGRGVVIRGGGVDGDNCERHRGGARGGVISSGPVYLPNPTARPGGVFVGGTSRVGGGSIMRQPASSGSASTARSAVTRARRG